MKVEQTKEEYLRENERIILYDIPLEFRGSFFFYSTSVDCLEYVVPENTAQFEGDVMIEAVKLKYYNQWLDTWPGGIALGNHLYEGRYWNIKQLNDLLVVNGILNTEIEDKNLIALRALIIEQMILPYKYHRLSIPELTVPISINRCVVLATNELRENNVYTAREWFDICKKLTKIAIQKFYNYDLQVV